MAVAEFLRDLRVGSAEFVDFPAGVEGLDAADFDGDDPFAGQENQGDEEGGELGGAEHFRCSYCTGVSGLGVSLKHMYELFFY